MRVLRANAEALITVVQVFVRNPLYKWALDHKRGGGAAAGGGGRGGGGGGGSGSAKGTPPPRDAELSLLRMQRKLAGHVSAGHESLGVEGQVRRLIDEARSEENLSRMFEGWAAWI